MKHFFSKYQDELTTALIGLCLALAVLGLSGCASTKPDAPTAEDTIKAGVVVGAIDAAKAPLFRLTCPTTGCVIGSLEVGNPSGAGQLADVVKVAMSPQPSEASQNFRAVLGVVSHIGGYAIIGNAASNIMGKITDGFKAGFTSNASIAGAGFEANGKIAGMIPQPGAVSNTTNTLSGTGVLGSGTYTAPITTTTNPSPKVCVPTYSAAGVPTGFSCTGG